MKNNLHLMSSYAVRTNMDIIERIISINKACENGSYSASDFPYEKFLDYLANLSSMEFIPTEFLIPRPMCHPNRYMRIYMKEFIKKEKYAMYGDCIQMIRELCYGLDHPTSEYLEGTQDCLSNSTEHQIECGTDSGIRSNSIIETKLCGGDVTNPKIMRSVIATDTATPFYNLSEGII